MGILDRLTGANRLAAAALYQLDSGTPSGDVLGASPRAAAAFGVDVSSDRVDRQLAMTIPAVRRGRQVICGTIGALELRAHRTQAGSVDDVTGDYRWLTQPDPNVSRHYLLTWTVDDLLWYGVAWWRVTSRAWTGYPASFERLTRDRVVVDQAAGVVRVDGIVVEDRDLVRFDGPDEGVLEYGGRTLRTCLMIEEAVRKFARLDVPLGVLEPVEGGRELSWAPGSAGDGTERSEVDALLDGWQDARAYRTTAYLQNVHYNAVQFSAEQLELSEVRQQQAAEVARLMNLAPRHVNAPNASTMTYATTESDRRDLLDTSLVGYVAALDQRLSMPDVTPAGTRVHLATGPLLRGDTLAALQADEIAVAIGALDPEEVRTGTLQLPPRPAGVSAQPPAVAALLDLVASLPEETRNAVAAAVRARMIERTTP